MNGSQLGVSDTDAADIPSEIDLSESYGAWQSRFMAERLRLLYYLGLIANPATFMLDFLLFDERLPSLLAIRLALEVGYLIGLFALLRPVRVLNPPVLLIFWVFLGGVCVTHITVLLSGFTSQYYSGMKLVFLAAAVIVPVSWPIHLFAQLISVAYYYALNLSKPLSFSETEAAIGTGFFLFWMCLALLCSVYLYERLQRAELRARLSERLARQELKAANDSLKDMNYRKSEFVSMVSHELRTPMAAIHGYVDNMLVGIGGAVNDRHRHYLEKIQLNIERLTRMINDLLDLSRMEAGRVDIRLESIPVPSFVNNIVEGLQVVANHKSLTLRTDVDGQAIFVRGDPDKFTQVLTNLIHNAIKFTAPGGTIRVEVAVENGFAQVCVADTGCGISPTEMEKVFNKFHRGQSEESGAGLGLAIAKQLVELHHGRIWAQSTPGEGSQFFFTMPLVGQESYKEP